MKKVLSFAIALAMVFSLVACGNPAPSESPSDTPKGIYTAGTYTDESAGMNGPVKVEVTVSDAAITAIKVLEHKETAGLGDVAIDPMITKIMDAQATAVDAQAGATITSDAIKGAVQKCLDKAMGKEVTATATGYTAGTYSATVDGHNGPMTVEATFDAASITAAKVTDHKETYGIGYGLNTSPIEVLPVQIVKEQSLAVDAVSSATITSAAIKGAIADCVTQAGGNVEALKSAPVNKPAPKDETFEVDIVVVGAGGAGLAAAVTALEAGANVMVLEKVGITGGSTTRSGGKILAAGTPWQDKQSQVDNPDMMYDFLMSYDREGALNPDLVRPFCDASAENLKWLEDRGVQMQDVEPIHSSLTPLRVHNAKGGGGQTSGHGGQFCVPLTLAFENGGGKILYDCRADKLITDDSGAVVGVSGKMANGSTITVNAKSVILATGGYAHNEEMLKKYNDFLPTNVGSGVPMTNTGDGLVMATEIGAKNTDGLGLQLVYVNYDSYVGIAEESGLIVDAKGNRIVDEWTYQSHVAQALADAKSPVGYYIATANDPNPTVQRGMGIDAVPHAATIEELAAQISMDPAVLKATIDRYNELCTKGSDDDFGKPAAYMIPIEGNMYYAFKMNPGSSVTFGGLSIDPQAHVLDTNNKPIPGLFAAGEVAYTGLFAAEYPCCGMAIGSAVYYGRVAAENAVASK